MVPVEFAPLRPLEAELGAWMEYVTRTVCVAYGVSRELLGLTVGGGELKPRDRFAAVVLEMEMVE